MVSVAENSASVGWSNIPLDVEGWPFGLYQCGEVLYMFLTDSEQLWVKRRLPFKVPRGRDPEYLWEPAHLLPPPPEGTFDFQPATIVVALGNYFMLFTLDGPGALWRSVYDGTQNSNPWEYVGWTPGVQVLAPNTLAVSVELRAT